MKVSFEVVRKLRVIADDALVLSDECLTHVRSCSALGDLPVTVFGLTNAPVNRVRNAKDRPTRILRSCANSSASTLNEPSADRDPKVSAFAELAVHSALQDRLRLVCRLMLGADFKET